MHEPNVSIPNSDITLEYTVTQCQSTAQHSTTELAALHSILNMQRESLPEFMDPGICCRAARNIFVDVSKNYRGEA